MWNANEVNISFDSTQLSTTKQKETLNWQADTLTYKTIIIIIDK